MQIYFGLDSTELIEEIKTDIEEFGSDTQCLYWFEELKPGLKFITNYDFCKFEDLTEEELIAASKRNAEFFEGTLAEVLILLEAQSVLPI